MSRWKAAAIHLSISLLIGAIVLALLFGLWYPQPYFGAAGGQHLVMVLLSVDLVLGPLLTLVLFKSGKKGMLFDLCVIGILQFSALIYGLHVITESRPVFIVAAIDRFNVVSANEIDAADLAKGRTQEYRTLSWTGPRLVAAQLPTDTTQRNKVMDLGIAGKDIERMPEFYAAYETEAANLLRRAKPLKDLRKLVPTSESVIDDWLRNSGRHEQTLAWVPVNAKKASLVMLLDQTTGGVIAALPIEPW